MCRVHTVIGTQETKQKKVWKLVKQCSSGSWPRASGWYLTCWLNPSVRSEGGLHTSIYPSGWEVYCPCLRQNLKKDYICLWVAIFYGPLYILSHSRFYNKEISRSALHLPVHTSSRALVGVYNQYTGTPSWGPDHSRLYRDCNGDPFRVSNSPRIREKEITVVRWKIPTVPHP